MAITSRQNPIVSRFRDAANGDGASVLLDGAHLLADAIAANAAIALAAVTTVSRAKPEIAARADSLAQRGLAVTTVGVSVAGSADAEAAIDEARRRGCRIVATVPRGGTPVFETDLSGPVVILVGGEGPGLRPAIAAAAGVRVTIPMQPPVESLNAAVTA